MKGLILADVNIIKKMDTDIENEPKGISKIIPATIKKDGEISDRGTSAVTKEQFVYLQKYMEKIIKQISEEILQGNIEVKPYYNASTKKHHVSIVNTSLYAGLMKIRKTMNINIFQN